MNDEETHKAGMANTYKALFDDDFDDREKDDIFKIQTNKWQVDLVKLDPWHELIWC